MKRVAAKPRIPPDRSGHASVSSALGLLGADGSDQRPLTPALTLRENVAGLVAGGAYTIGLRFTAHASK